MLQLRKILLLDNLYIILLIIVIILLILRLSLPVKSEYTSSTNSLTGIVLKKVYKDEKLTLIVKQREKVLVSKYSKTDLNINLGDKIYIKGKIFCACCWKIKIVRFFQGRIYNELPNLCE